MRISVISISFDEVGFGIARSPFLKTDSGEMPDAEKAKWEVRKFLDKHNFKYENVRTLQQSDPEYWDGVEVRADLLGR